MFSAGLRGVIAAPLEAVRRRTAPHPDQVDSVNTIIESEIIPRLLMAHSATQNRTRPRMLRAISSDEATRFAMLPLRLEAAALLEEVDAFMAKGASVETICLDLLAPAARKLGEMWERDECDFLDVTMGLWRLQEVMREVAARAPVDLAGLALPHSALFTPMPGDHHNFGTLMLEEVFARGGWRSEALVKPERRELLDRLARQPFDLVGLTLARDCPSAALSNLIQAIRNVSANPHIIVLVGGRMINENPGMAVTVGADGTGADALTALETANALVETVAARHLNLG
ncbi:MAG: cobalamin-dependent protein [Porphyrobacter sp.]|nr:cobalamin-dependent protein [Porphyrobacter sp.]